MLLWLFVCLVTLCVLAHTPPLLLLLPLVLALCGLACFCSTYSSLRSELETSWGCLPGLIKAISHHKKLLSISPQGVAPIIPINVAPNSQLYLTIVLPFLNFLSSQTCMIFLFVKLPHFEEM